MKKILYIDLLSPMGHDKYNMNMLRILKKSYDVVFMARQFMLDKIPCQYYNKATACPDVIFPEHWIGNASLSFMFKWRLAQYKFIRETLNKSQPFDKIFFSSVDIFSFALATHNIDCSKVSFVDHGIYRLKNPATRFAYKYILNSNIQIIALEKYIRDYLRENGIKNKISVIHHPIPEQIPIDAKSPKISKICSIFAPSCSNDEEFITSLIKERSRIPKNVRVFIKSRKQEFFNENLNVFKARIDDNEYNKLFEQSDYILVPYENDYNYRTSAILFEALYLEKRVLLWNNNTLHKYFDIFNEAVFLFRSLEEFINAITNINELKFNESHIHGFMEMYSDEYINRQISKAFS